jgi:hypothetical protein
MMPDKLPAAAKRKLSDLNLQRMAAEDAGRSANVRLNSLGRDPDRELAARLTAERDRHNDRFRQLSLLVNRVNQWIVEQRLPLEPAPAVAAVKLMPDETLGEALGKARDEIAALKQHLAAVKLAPLPPEDQQQLAEAYVARLVTTAGPQVNFHGDRLTLRWRDDIVTSKEDALALFAWAAPDQVYAALTRSIKEQPVRADAMPAAERKRRVAEIEAELLRLEVFEEALIARAAGDGLEVLRRPDASPAAVLGVVVVAKARTEAA